MASCRAFELSFKGQPNRLFTQMKSKLEQQGGTLRGDSNKGLFSVDVPLLGKVKGRYVITNKKATIEITDRPFLLSCGAIESFVKANIPQ